MEQDTTPCDFFCVCVCVLGMTKIAEREREAVGWMIIDENSDGTRKGKRRGRHYGHAKSPDASLPSTVVCV